MIAKWDSAACRRCWSKEMIMLYVKPMVITAKLMMTMTKDIGNVCHHLESFACKLQLYDTFPTVGASKKMHYCTCIQHPDDILMHISNYNMAKCICPERLNVSFTIWFQYFLTFTKWYPGADMLMKMFTTLLSALHGYKHKYVHMWAEGGAGWGWWWYD